MSGPVRGRTLVALLLGLASVSSAQPWESEEKKKEAERVLGRVETIMAETSRGNAAPAAEAQGDASWMVRLMGAIRLGVVGLDASVTTELKRAALPSQGALAADHPARKAADEFARKNPGQGEAEKTEKDELFRIVSALIVEEYRSSKGDASVKRQLLEELFPFAGLVSDKAQAWYAGLLLSLTDQPVALADLGVKDVAAAVKEDGEAVYAWYAANASFFYWHPKERRLRVDQEARTAQQPSAEYRKTKAWRADEGPNSSPAQEGGR